MKAVERKKIEGLTARAARGRSKTPALEPDHYFPALQQIQDAILGGKKSLRIPKTDLHERVKNEIEARGFTVKDTGHVLHVTWEK